jgi:uncharacterized protein (DUF1501 family)
MAMMSRRHCLQAAAAASLLVPLGRHAFAAKTTAGERRLVVVFLRGAADGLSIVVPHGDAAYYQLRNEIAIARPGEADGALPLTSLFGLHPALAPLLQHWQAGHLAFVHASGSPDATRSHFDAQDYMESATPGRKSTPDGWMNRLLGVMGEGRSTRGVNVGPTMPRIFAGAASVTSMPLQSRAARADDPALMATLGKLYAESDAVTSRAWRDMLDSKRILMDSDNAPGTDPNIDRGALPAQALAGEAQRLGQLMQREASMRLGFFSVGGWDTHVRQGGAKGQLANRLAVLAGGLNALIDGLGDRFEDTVIVVMSEFGRTARQNGNQGTDHGHGNVMWLLGGRVAGGQVLGRWPGLDGSALNEGRDLAITTDFRHVIAGVLTQHLQLGDAALARVLPELPRTAAVSVMDS